MATKAKSAAGTKLATGTTAQAEKPEQKVEATGAPDAPAPELAKDETAPATSVTEQPTENAALVVTAPQGAKDMPSLEAAMDGDAVEGLWIRSVPVSIRRAGYRFTREGVGFAANVLMELFSAEQYQQLLSDPDLVVEECSFIDGEPQR